MSRTSRLRWLGAAVGLVVGTCIATAAYVVDGITTMNPIGTTVTAPVVTTAILIGAWMTPALWGCETDRAWTVTTMRSALLAVALGDLLEVMAIATSPMASLPEPGLWAAGLTVAEMGVVYAFGLVGVGWFALVFTFLGSGLGAILIWVIRSGLERRQHS